MRVFENVETPITQAPFNVFELGGSASQASFFQQREQFADEELARSLAGARILLVEDEGLIAFELETRLNDIGAQPLGPAATLAKAQRLSDCSEIDGAILDINLNGVDVYPLAQSLSARGVPFLFHTGHGKRNALEAMFPGVLLCEKPCGASAVLAALATLLGRN